MRVRSGIKLVAFFLVAVVVCAAFGDWWAVKISGAIAELFAIVTLIEFINARRKRQQAHSMNHFG